MDSCAKMYGTKEVKNGTSSTEPKQDQQLTPHPKPCVKTEHNVLLALAANGHSKYPLMAGNIPSSHLTCTLYSI